MYQCVYRVDDANLWCHTPMMKGYDQEDQTSPASEIREPLHEPLVGKEDHPLAAAGRTESARVQSPPEAGHWVPPGASRSDRGRSSGPKEGQYVM